MTRERSDDPLATALEALAGADATVGASAAVEARLLEEVRSLGRGRRRRRTVAGLIAAGFLAVAGASIWLTTASPTLPGGVTPHAEAPGGDVATEFLPLTYAHVPASEMYVVRIDVPREALVAVGLAPLEGARQVWADSTSGARDGSRDHGSSSTVLADVLVGPDGLARYVRFVSATVTVEAPAARTIGQSATNDAWRSASALQPAGLGGGT